MNEEERRASLTSKAQPIFPQTAQRIEVWKKQPELAGVLLVGSKSRGYGDRLSDDDLEVVLEDEAHARLNPSECIEYLTEGEGEARRLIYDAQYVPLGELRRKAGSPRDLDHWPYESSPVLFDRDGRVMEAVEAAARMDASFREARLRHATIDAGVAIRRASKTQGRGMESAARLLLARGAKALTRLLFALEGRWVPLDHWLEPELATLKEGGQESLLLLEAVRAADPKLLGDALASLEERLYREGVPRPAGRLELFFELIHPARAAEREIHGLN